MFRQYFPRGIAKGEPFFNRAAELKRLIGNIEGGTHTVLMAPRRYGKSSLVKYAIRKVGLPYCEVDLFVATGDLDISKKILRGIESVIHQVSSEPMQWLQSLQDFFKRYDKKWMIGVKGMSLELMPQDPNTVSQNILEALQALEYILKKKETKTIIFLDEFQEILDTASSKALEGAIRHFAQESEQVIFIFSGSNRRMLKKLFEDRSRPLYSLCDEIRLDRIEAGYYVDYLRKVSKKTFNKILPDEVIELILSLTDRHPRYVYLLCTEVWIKAENTFPTMKMVKSAWQMYVIQKYKDVGMELSNRAQTQLRLMKSIANGHTINLSGKDTLLSLGLTSSAVVQALKGLEALDYIERLSTGEYRIIDPLIKAVLTESV